MARIGIIGSEGAMGAALISVVQRSDHELSGGIDRGGDPAGLADRSDVLVDFSAPQALDANLHAAIGAGIPLVIGSSDQLDPITPPAIRESPDWAGVTLTWTDPSKGGLHRGAVAIRIQLLRDLHDYYGNPRRAFIEAVDEVLIREVYGNLVAAAGR